MVRPLLVAALAAGLGFLTSCRADRQTAAPPAPPPAGTPPSSSQSAGRPSASLAPGRPVEAELEGNEVRAHPLELAAGTFVRIAVDQIGIDVVARLRDPRGAELIRFDRMTGTARPEHVLWIAEEAGHHTLEIEAFGGRERSGRYRVRLEELRPATGDDRRRLDAELLFAEGDALRRRPGEADWLLAAARLEEAVEVWRKLGDRARQADGLYRLGLARETFDPERASAAFEETVALLDDGADAWQKAAALHWLGHLHDRLGELERALGLYRRALPLRRRSGDARGEAHTLNNLGLTCQKLGEIPEALEHYRLALALYRRLGDARREALALHNLGKSYLSAGLVSEARDSLVQALDLRRRLGDLRGEASTLSAIGQTHARESDLERALGTHRQAFELSRRAGDRLGEAVALSDTALTHHQRGESEAALETFERALEVFRELGHRQNAANTRLNLGWVLDAAGRGREAMDHYRQALEVFESSHQRHGMITALHLMAVADRRRGELTAARAHLESALAEIERLRSRPHSPALRTAYFASKHGTFEAYVDLLMELHRRQPEAGHDAEALAASERARARSQLDALTESGADLTRGVDASLRQRERELEDRIEALEIRRLDLAETGADASELAEMERRLRDLFLAHDRVQGEIRRASPRYAALTQPRPLSPVEIRGRVVDAETLLLEYDLGEERSYLWAVTPEAVRSFELPPRVEVEKTARRAYRLLSSSNLTTTRVQTALTLETLSATVLAPAAELLAGKRLLVVADGALQYVPFGALPAPGSDDAEPLAEAHEVVSVPSASTLDALRRQLAGRPAPAGTVAVVADPVFGLDDPRFGEALPERRPSGARAPRPDPRRYERLAFSRQEAETILALAPADTRFAALGFEADRDTVTGGRLADYRFLHFATHGELNTAHPELSRLVLSRLDAAGRPRDGYLFAHEIYNLELAADLVVLSACQTALGAEVRGEGLLGLTQGFLYAGAASVIVSLWKVDDRATAELMGRFYRELLAEGRRPAAALRAAQASIRREKRWRDPYYWAGFVLQGEWR